MKYIWHADIEATRAHGLALEWVSGVEQIVQIELCRRRGQFGEFLKSSLATEQETVFIMISLILITKEGPWGGKVRA